MRIGQKCSLVVNVQFLNVGLFLTQILFRKLTLPLMLQPLPFFFHFLFWSNHWFHPNFFFCLHFPYWNLKNHDYKITSSKTVKNMSLIWFYVLDQASDVRLYFTGLILSLELKSSSKLTSKIFEIRWSPIMSIKTQWFKAH